MAVVDTKPKKESSIEELGNDTNDSQDVVERDGIQLLKDVSIFSMVY